MNTTEFRYDRGNPVQAGDVVRTGNGMLGRVVMVIGAGSAEAAHYSCPSGGILVEENWDGRRGLLLIAPPDGPEWQDLQFVRRAKPESSPSGYGRLLDL